MPKDRRKNLSTKSTKERKSKIFISMLKACTVSNPSETSNLLYSYLSDTEKMVLQLQLDAQRLGTILTGLGFAVSELPQYASLLQSLK